MIEQQKQNQNLPIITGGGESKSQPKELIDNE